jgi:metallo-beta-lactamase family protein
MKLKFIGSTETVTGSMLYGETAQVKFLVDAGLYQGEDTPKKDSLEKSIEPKELDYIFLTHAHLDHCGYIPRLYKLGFRGQVICTFQTTDVAKVIMEDNARIEQERVKKLNKKITKEKAKHEAFYEIDHVTKVLSHFKSYDFQKNITLKDISLKFYRSGHILGAASILLHYKDKNFLFSGDVGKGEDLIHIAKDHIDERVDYLILESTYGAREHREDDLHQELHNILLDARNKAKRVIIPAFSFGRSQLVATLLYQIFEKDPALKMPVYLDSPMSHEIFEIYERETKELKLTRDEFKKIFQNLNYVEFPKQRESLLNKEAPIIILTSSGMMSGGPIENYLQAFGEEKDNVFIVTGYQAKGTRGFELTHENMQMLIKDKSVVFKAELVRLHGLSSHADQSDLIDIVKELKPKTVFLQHGEDESKKVLNQKLKELGFDSYAPSHDEEFSFND